MQVTIMRFCKSSGSTLGALFINGSFECFTLEDKDRGLSSNMDLYFIKSLKVCGSTCIPSGLYNIEFTYSPHFRKVMPLIDNVKGFEAIRIHAGNTVADTDGCILVGDSAENAGDYRIGSSQTAFRRLYLKLEAAIKANERIYLQIGYDNPLPF